MTVMVRYSREWLQDPRYRQPIVPVNPGHRPELREWLERRRVVLDAAYEHLGLTPPRRPGNASLFD